MSDKIVLIVNEHKKEKDISYYLTCKDIQIGRCLCSIVNGNTLHIKYITIYKDFRGCNISSIFYKMMEEMFIKNKIMKVTLMAEEIATNHKKLESLYELWGFIKTSERYTYNCNTLVRHIHMYKMLTHISKL